MRDIGRNTTTGSNVVNSNGSMRRHADAHIRKGAYSVDNVGTTRPTLSLLRFHNYRLHSSILTATLHTNKSRAVRHYVFVE